MRDWKKTASNVLLILGVVAGLLAVVSAVGWFERPALSAEPQELDLGEVASGATVPLGFTLHNHTARPVRLVGALYAP